jgi:hypothetical protein
VEGVLKEKEGVGSMRFFLIYAAVAYAYGVFLNGSRIYNFLKRFRLHTFKEYSRLACYFAPSFFSSLLTFPFYLFYMLTQGVRIDGHLDTLFMKDCLAVLIIQKDIDEIYRDYLRPPTCKTPTMVYNEGVEGE